MTSYTATYSPEDNKLRLYASSRLDAETYARVKAAGFGWAPRQELFVAPAWSPQREDLLIELAGEIEPEGMTLAERAQAKADRLDELAGKRHRQSNAYNRAAEAISERFAFGQPILVGHHSERKARKDQERMHSAMDKAVSASKAADYWLYRAEGVEAHANYKNDPKVRANRIKTLLAELRDLQRRINHAHLCLGVWEKITTDEAIKIAIGRSIATGTLAADWNLYSQVEKGEVTPQDARQKSIDAAKRTIASDNLRRWIEHTLNRLSYERELLGPVSRYEGPLTAVILQGFAREHGAHKPEGKDVDGVTFVVKSDAALPLHLANGDTMLEMTGDEWRDLMQSAGYEVPEKKDAKAPILNFKAAKLESASRYTRGKIDTLRQIELTKEAYGKIYEEHRGVRLSICGQFRFRICLDPTHEGPRYQAGWVAVFLTDQKAHPVPDSPAVTLTAPVEAEARA